MCKYQNVFLYHLFDNKFLNDLILWIFSRHVEECWQILGHDHQLTINIMDHLLETLARILPYEEKPDPRYKDQTIRVATIQPLAVGGTMCQSVALIRSFLNVKSGYLRLTISVNCWDFLLISCLSVHVHVIITLLEYKFMWYKFQINSTFSENFRFSYGAEFGLMNSYINTVILQKYEEIL